MSNSRGLSVLIASALLVVVFQNCGRHQLLDTSDGGASAALSSSTSTASHLAVSSRISADEPIATPTPDPTAVDGSSPPTTDTGGTPLVEQPQVQVRFEAPTAIEFGGAPLTVAVAQNVSIGRNHASGGISRYVDDGAFQFNLNLRTGRIMDKDTGRIAYQLTSTELATLKDFFKGSVIINSSSWAVQDLVCTQIYSPGYGRLLTNRGFYELGAQTSSCSVLDLYNIQQKSPVGLKEFLAGIEDKIVNPPMPTPTPNNGTLIGPSSTNPNYYGEKNPPINSGGFGTWPAGNSTGNPKEYYNSY